MPRWISLALVLWALVAQPRLVADDEELESPDFDFVRVKAVQLSKRQRGPSSVLVVFDIDNTLLASHQPLGSDQWFMWQADLLRRAPSSEYLVASSILDLVAKQTQLLALNHMRLTQSTVPSTLGRLMERGHPLLILTARGPDSSDLTRRSLAEFGIVIDGSALRLKKALGETFRPQALANIQREFSDDEREEFGLNKTSPVRYSGGIFFSAGQHKGAMLRLLVAAASDDIGAVVFIDDQLRNTHGVFQALGDKLDVTTIRFSKEDAAIEGFLGGDKQRVHRQWLDFKRLEATAFD